MLDCDWHVVVEGVVDAYALYGLRCNAPLLPLIAIRSNLALNHAATVVKERDKLAATSDCRYLEIRPR